MSVGQIEQGARGRGVLAADSGLVAEQEAARRRARAAQRRKTLTNLLIRAVSLVIVLSVWEHFGRQVNPVLFTYPTAVAAAGRQMIASGELWQYLSQSLFVLAFGLALSSAFGIALGLVMARFWVLDIAIDTYITAL